MSERRRPADEVTRPDIARPPVGVASSALPIDTAERIHLLRVEVQRTLQDEFLIVASDLEQLRGLLGDAACKLTGAFRNVTTCSDRLVRSIDDASASPTPELIEGLDRIARDIHATSGMTVQSLQFDDMAGQLLSHVSRRLAILEAFSKDMSVVHPHADPSRRTLTPSAVDELFETVDRYRAELSQGGRKVVQQHSLDAGGIELF